MGQKKELPTVEGGNIWVKITSNQWILTIIQIDYFTPSSSLVNIPFFFSGHRPPATLWHPRPGIFWAYDFDPYQLWLL